jgi:dTMP kinase
VALLIDIEGIDGSGKGTQAKRLCDRLNRENRKAMLISFPRYDATLFGKAVGEFLNGRYGTLDQVHPFLVSLLFAGDRLESKEHLREAMRTHDVVVLDRYVPSNVAHQASKRDGAERDELTQRILQIEFDIHGLPRPDLVLLLDLPVSVSQQLVARKAARNYTDQKADLQEADGTYMAGVREAYLTLSKTEPNWQVIPCCEGDRLRTIEEVEELVWRAVAEKFPKTA